jgi:hypothetical protein
MEDRFETWRIPRFCEVCLEASRNFALNLCLATREGQCDLHNIAPVNVFVWARFSPKSTSPDEGRCPSRRSTSRRDLSRAGAYHPRAAQHVEDEDGRGSVHQGADEAPGVRAGVRLQGAVRPEPDGGSRLRAQEDLRHRQPEREWSDWTQAVCGPHATAAHLADGGACRILACAAFGTSHGGMDGAARHDASLRVGLAGAGGWLSGGKDAGRGGVAPAGRTGPAHAQACVALPPTELIAVAVCFRILHRRSSTR